GEARALVLWAGKKCSPLDLSLLSTNSAVWFGRLPRQRHVADEVDRHATGEPQIAQTKTILQRYRSHA
ncbi:MAG: hypothetical protein P8N73_13710, partial [Pseudomonadales bacterium]|nr:hypothetical protein [Pseudomonadales bacterium]